MQLTPEQQAVLDGSRGEVMAKVMKTLVIYGETFGATKMVPVTGRCGHLVTSFGLGVLGPVYQLMDQLIEAGALSSQKFTADPRPLDSSVPANFLQNALFKIMYSKQSFYEKQLQRLGLLSEDGFTCTCYLTEVGNRPSRADVLSWAESSAVVFANSVLGARCNRNSGILELFGSIAGCVPYFGLLTDEGRKASWVVDIKTSKLPEAQLLGSAIGLKVMEDVPYIRGLAPFLGEDVHQERTEAYLKDMGAATASNGAVGLFHVEGITPEAAEQGDRLIRDDARHYIIDDAELARVKAAYPCIWQKPNAKPKLCFVGCPHLTLYQIKDWIARLDDGLKRNGLQKVRIPTVFTAAPAVCKQLSQLPLEDRLREMGIVVSSICPLMYMNNPLCAKMPVITNSNKLRTYSSARYHTDEEIVTLLTEGGRRS